MRNRGTVGGALFTADKGGCYPAALIGLDGTVCTTRRDISAASFFGAPDGAGSLAGDEIITGLRVPVPLRATYQCIRPTPGRFALVGLFASIRQEAVRVGVSGYGPRAFRALGAEQLFDRQSPEPALTEPVILFGSAALSGLQGNASYKEAMARLLLRRARAALLE
jgi:carbon-monoxide dehydrogenase medium subunit